MFCLGLSIIDTSVGRILSYFGLSKQFVFTNTFLYYLGYFYLGGHFAKYDVKKKNCIAVTTFILALMITVFGSYFFTYKYFYSFLSINTAVISIALFLLIKWNFDKDFKLNAISKLSLGIYLVHPIFIDLLSFIGKDWLLSRLDVYIYIPLASIIVFTFSYLAAFIMSNIKFLNKCV